VERWKGGKVERWKGGKVERWKGGKVERWKGGKVNERGETRQTTADLPARQNAARVEAHSVVQSDENAKYARLGTGTSEVSDKSKGTHTARRVGRFRLEVCKPEFNLFKRVCGCVKIIASGISYSRRVK
jgi:hypothetical protein